MSERLQFSRTLQGIEPVYRSFTPTWTNLTVGNGSQDFEYCQIGKLVHYMGDFTFGSTTSVTGNITINVPVNNDTSVNGTNFTTCTVTDSGVNDFGGSVYMVTNGFLVGTMTVSGTYPYFTVANATTPFTWTTNDRIRFSIVYKAA